MNLQALQLHAGTNSATVPGVPHDLVPPVTPGQSAYVIYEPGPEMRRVVVLPVGVVDTTCTRYVGAMASQYGGVPMIVWSS